MTADGNAARHSDGTCTFLEADGHLCAIHHAAGQDALPLSCRMFPRVVLHDGRGIFISLSHFCPTAAGLLFEDGNAWSPVGIVDAPPALTDIGPLDGLDARNVWPPLLRPGVMTDLESYGAWERLGVELLTREGIAAGVSLDALDSTTARVAIGRPAVQHRSARGPRRLRMLPPPPTAALEAHDRALKRWLAARLFGNWIAYQGDGLSAIVRYLRGCLATFTTELARDGSPLEAVRRSDLLIVHNP